MTRRAPKHQRRISTFPISRQSRLSLTRNPSTPESPLANEQGFALILTVFIVALLIILVLEFADETLAYQRSSRQYTEGIQSEFILKSGINLGKILLELPKEEGIREDWLGQPWALIAAAPSLPISGFLGEPRIAIFDEAGKINLNAMVEGAGRATAPPPISSGAQIAGVPATPQQAFDEQSSYWKNALAQLFNQLGFQKESFKVELHRTPGNASYASNDQVAVVHDWLDIDDKAHSDASFPGEGIESGSNSQWFYNRPMRSLSELALVPGMTLERVSRVAPFLRAVSGVTSQINVNTAPLPVLVAMGFSESQAAEIVQERQSLPFNTEQLRTLVAGDAQLARVTTTRSQEFSVYARVATPNGVRYAKAILDIQNVAGGQRKAVVRALELL